MSTTKDKVNLDSPSVTESFEFDVQGLHSQIVREYQEPHDGFEPVPFWMLVIFACLLGWGGWYIGMYSADFSSTAMDRSDPKFIAFKTEDIPKDQAGLMRLGEKVFAQCATCHQANGEGNYASGFPPLNKSEWVVGDKYTPARLSRILLYGLAGDIEVRGQQYGKAQMPAWASNLKDHQIAAVLTYIRNSWDNKGDPVWPQDVAAARKAVGSRGSMSAKELEAIPLNLVDPGAKSAAPVAGTAGVTAKK